jgi:hypothetical protein
MTGSSLAPIVIPIVMLPVLASWLTIVYYAANHPQNKRPGRSAGSRPAAGSGQADAASSQAQVSQAEVGQAEVGQAQVSQAEVGQAEVGQVPRQAGPAAPPAGPADQPREDSPVGGTRR